MRGESCHLIENFSKVVLNLFSHIDSLLKEVNIAHFSIDRPILQTLSCWIPLFQVSNDDLMNLQSEFLFYALAYPSGYVLTEFLIYLLLVVVDGNIWRLVMFNINEHFQGVVHGHGQVVQLIQSQFVCENTLEKDWEKVSLPIDESATCRFVDVLLPVGDHIDLPCAVLKTLLRLDFQNVLKDQALAVVDDCLTQ